MSLFITTHATQEAAEHVAAYRGGDVHEVAKREKDMTFTSLWEVRTQSHPGIPQQRHSTLVESTRVEETWEPHQSNRGWERPKPPSGPPGPGRYCAPLRCYCTDPACPATKRGGYSTEDLLATARQTAAMLRARDGFVEEVPREVRRRAWRWMTEGAPAWTGVQEHLREGYVDPSDVQAEDVIDSEEPTGMRVSSRTKRQVVKRA